MNRCDLQKIKEVENKGEKLALAFTSKQNVFQWVEQHSIRLLCHQQQSASVKFTKQCSEVGIILVGWFDCFCLQ